ncbi:MAG: hypothetical protein H0T71_14295 [Acidobacteria bacterium]|nr:hypothetical protein [Acidobacteriota bacterium]
MRPYHRLTLALIIAILAACGPFQVPPTIKAPDEPVLAIPYQDLVVSMLDGAGKAIVGAEVVTPTHDSRISDGNGFSHMAVPGQVLVVVSAEGFDTKEIDLPPKTHRVHLTRTKQTMKRTAQWTGRLSVSKDQRCFQDETGDCQLPVLAHFGEAFSAYVRRPMEVEAQLVAIKAAGYDGIRFWDTLGYDGAWLNKEVMPWAFMNKSGQRIPATLHYYTRLREFVKTLQAIGLTAHHTRGDLNGRSLNEVVGHAERVAAIYDDIGWDVMALFEGNNEDFQNGSFGAEGLLRIVGPGARRGAITASSCPAGCTEKVEDLKAFTKGFSVFYVHGYRDGEPTDKLRHIFSLGYEAEAFGDRRLGWQGEPTGPNEFPGFGVTVGHTENVEELALLAVQSLMSRQVWVYMSQYGVFWNGRIETHKGFAAVPRMRDVLEKFAPDVMSYSITHGGRGDAKFKSTTGYYGDPGVSVGPARIDQAYSKDGQRVVATVHGGKGPATIRNLMGCAADVTLVHANADESVEAHTFRTEANATLAIKYRVGRLLLAQCVQ